MSVNHRYSSWGRTRRPKNIAGVDGTTVTAADSAELVTVDGSQVNGGDWTTTISSVQSLTGNLLVLNVADSTNFSVGQRIQISGNGRIDGEYAIEASAANRISIRIVIDAGPRLTNANQIPGAGNIRRRTTGGYLTENQRFLHLSTASNGTITGVWAYTYASGRWAEIKTKVHGIGFADLDGAPDGIQVDEMTAPAESLVSVAVGNATHRIIDITGIDRIAITGTNDFYASTSTF